MKLNLHAKHATWLLQWSLAFATLLLSQHSDSIAQGTGYMYVHLKTLNEAQSPDVSFSVSGPAAVAGFTLNDMPTQIEIDDMGASQNGRLWGVGRANGTLYYRNAASSLWIQTSITDVNHVDGGPGNSAFYVTSTGTVRVTADGVTSSAISGSIAASDVGSGWDNRPYIVTSAGAILRYDGAGNTNTDWTAFSNSFVFGRIDVDPSSGKVYATRNSGSNNFSYMLVPDATNGNTAASVTSIGRAGPSGLSARDIAVNDAGEVFAIIAIRSTGGWYVARWNSGTTWEQPEATSFDAFCLTGGAGHEMWATMMLDGSNSITPSPYFNIFSRALDGSTTWWVDDERVRITPTGNSIMIPVTPGTYNVTEAVPSGWDLQKITIYDPNTNSSSDLDGATASLTVEADQVVHVIFQTGEVHPFPMTTDCSQAYLETFGTNSGGTYGSPVNGQTSYHLLQNATLGGDGHYKIVAKVSDFNNWGNFFDHTSGDGTGMMYAVNASYDKNEFFRRRFTGIIPGATYNFSAWIADLTPGAPISPNVSFQIIDPVTKAVIAETTTGDLNGTITEWLQYKLVFTATSSEIDLLLVNNNVGGSGNDLAIDDISFSLSPPTPTIVIQNSSCTNGLGSINVTAPLGPDFEYSVDGTNWQTAPLFSDLASGIYTVYVRFTGTTNCTNSTTSATVKPSICGNVFHDANGLTDSNVNGTPIAATGASQLYVSLYNGTTLIATLPINPDGSYGFTEVEPNAAYTVVLGTDPAANTSSPFQGTGTGGWVATGEDCCDNTGNDGTPDGVLTINLGTGSVTNANFGVEQLPESDPKTTNISEPTIGKIITLNGGSNPPVLSGSDPEDMPTGGLLTGKSVIFTTVPTNSELYYDNVLLVDGSPINNFDPSKLQIKLTAETLGDTSTQFEYVYVDLAGKPDPTPAIYQLIWEDPMPVTLIRFDAAKSESAVQLTWATSSETNSAHFDIERSADARIWNAIGKISAGEFTNTLSEYNFADLSPARGTNYYRLKMVDMDETYSYSQIRSVSLQGAAVRIYPNPVSDRLIIEDAQMEEMQQLTLYNVSGQAVYTKKDVTKNSIEMSGLPKGVYILTIIYKSGVKMSRTVVKN